MMADLYRLNNFNYTFTATDSSVLLSDAISAQCNAIIINASEPVFIKITKHLFLVNYFIILRSHHKIFFKLNNGAIYFQFLFISI